MGTNNWGGRSRLSINVSIALFNIEDVFRHQSATSAKPTLSLTLTKLRENYR